MEYNYGSLLCLFQWYLTLSGTRWRGTAKAAQLQEQNIRIMGIKFVYNLSPRIVVSDGSRIMKLCQEQKTHLEQVDGSCYSISCNPLTYQTCLLTNFLHSAFAVCVQKWYKALLKGVCSSYIVCSFQFFCRYTGSYLWTLNVSALYISS
jgi:hypothetical protein